MARSGKLELHVLLWLSPEVQQPNPWYCKDCISPSEPEGFQNCSICHYSSPFACLSVSELCFQSLSQWCADVSYSMRLGKSAYTYTTGSSYCSGLDLPWCVGWISTLKRCSGNNNYCYFLLCKPTKKRVFLASSSRNWNSSSGAKGPCVLAYHR